MLPKGTRTYSYAKKIAINKYIYVGLTYCIAKIGENILYTFLLLSVIPPSFLKLT